MCFKQNYWIIQKGISKDYTKFVDSIKFVISLTNNVHIEFIDFIPFSLEYDIPKHIMPYDNIMVYGTQSLVEYLINKGFEPVAFTNENFVVDRWKNALGDEFLNYDCVIDTLYNLTPTLDNFIVRPYYDNKLIPGTKFSKQQFNEWKEKILALDCYSSISKDTLLCYAPLKNIINEYRLFVVDDEIITASMYVTNKIIKSSEHVPIYVYEYVEMINSLFQPHEAYCIDIAELDTGELKVIEYNCINTCGFYYTDIYKYVLSLTNKLIHR